MDDKSFTQVYFPKYRGMIEALARKVARTDQDLFDDLVSVGMELLWRLEPSNATKNEDAWIRSALYKRMISERRRERRRRSESLELLIERGAQVAQGDGGDPEVITPRGRRQQRQAEWDGAETEEA